MSARVVSNVEFIEIRGRRQRVVAELGRRARDNAALWRIHDKPADPPAPTATPAAAAAAVVTVKDPRP